MGRLDARPLALFRIAFSLTILFDLADRLRDFRAFYTDEGLLPRAEIMARPGRWSLFDLVGSPGAVALLYAAGVAAVVLLLIGYRTRLATIATFVFVHSLIERNILVCDSGDGVLRAMSFWLVFADAGACYSLDARRAPPPATVLAFPVRLLQLQVAIIYLFGALSKTGHHWRSGTAVELALLDDDFARSSGAWLASYPVVCMLLSRATLVIEAAFPVLVFSRRPILRRAALLSGLALHLGILATMRVGVFSVVMPVTYLLFLEREDLDALLPWLPSLSFRGMASARPMPRALVAVLCTQMGLVLAQQVVRLARREVPGALSAELEAVGLWQRWNLFAPNPPPYRLRWEVTSGRGDRTPPGMLPDRGFFYSRWNVYRFKLSTADELPALRALGRRLCRPGDDEVSLVLHATRITLRDQPPELEERAPLATARCDGARQ